MNQEDAGLLCALLDHLTDGRWPEGIASFCTEYGYDVEAVRDAWKRLTETADMSGPDDDDWDRVQEALDAEG